VTFGAGHFLVAWVDGRRDPVNPTFEILAARVEPDGTVLDGPGGISVDADPTIEGKAYPSVAFDGTNYLVAWQAGSFATYKPSGIFTVRISPTGTLIGAPPGGGGIVVAEPGDNYTRLYFPSLANRGPNSLIVWSNIEELYGATKSVSGAVVYP
jgi:hypothetical protein